MDKKINFAFNDASGKIFSFDNLRSFYEFAVQERDFWREKNEAVTKPSGILQAYLGRHSAFQNIINTIDSWGEKIPSWNDQQLNQELGNLKSQQLSQPNHYLWSGHEFIEPLIQCHTKYGNHGADAFGNLLIKGSLPNPIGNKEQFYGLMAAYEFLFQASDIVKRRNGEKVSLGHLRSQLADAKDRLFGEVEALKTGFSDWSTCSKEKSNQALRITTKLGARQRRRQDKSFEDNLRTWSATIEQLEKTYEEKLKLSKPAEYWNKAAKRYGRQGGLWTLTIIALVVVGLLYFREFFLTWLQGNPLPIQLSSLQGIVIFGSLVSVYAFLLRILSRLAFSSYHLMRDAEEREQLTYLYLSLSNESRVDNESREIVLQALFSRSETGLLTKEHGPTMPGAAEAIRLGSRAGAAR